MNLKNVFTYSVLFLALAISACNEDDEPEPDDQKQSSSANEDYQKPDMPSDGHAVLIAIDSRTELTYNGVPVNINSGMAFASFFDSQGSNTTVEVGKVTAQDSLLDLTSKKNYEYSPDRNFNQTGNTQYGIDYSSNPDVKWFVEGKNGFSQFTETHSAKWPVINSFPTSGPVNSSNDFKMEADVNNADSLMYVIAGPEGLAQKIKSGNSSSATFSSSKLQKLGTGDGFIQVNAFVRTPKTINNKKIYFIKEKTYTKNVKIE